MVMMSRRAWTDDRPLVRLLGRTPSNKLVGWAPDLDPHEAVSDFEFEVVDNVMDRVPLGDKEKREGISSGYATSNLPSFGQGSATKPQIIAHFWAEIPKKEGVIWVYFIQLLPEYENPDTTEDFLLYCAEFDPDSDAFGTWTPDFNNLYTLHHIVDSDPIVKKFRNPGEAVRDYEAGRLFFKIDGKRVRIAGGPYHFFDVDEAGGHPQIFEYIDLDPTASPWRGIFPCPYKNADPVAEDGNLGMGLVTVDNYAITPCQPTVDPDIISFERLDTVIARDQISDDNSSWASGRVPPGRLTVVVSPIDNLGNEGPPLERITFNIDKTQTSTHPDYAGTVMRNDGMTQIVRVSVSDKTKWNPRIPYLRFRAETINRLTANDGGPMSNAPDTPMSHVVDIPMMEPWFTGDPDNAILNEAGLVVWHETLGFRATTAIIKIPWRREGIPDLYFDQFWTEDGRPAVNEWDAGAYIVIEDDTIGNVGPYKIVRWTFDDDGEFLLITVETALSATPLVWWDDGTYRKIRFVSIWRYEDDPEEMSFNVFFSIPENWGPPEEPFAPSEVNWMENSWYPAYRYHANTGDIRVIGDIDIKGAQIRDEIFWSGYNGFAQPTPDMFPGDANHRHKVNGELRGILPIGQDGIIVNTTTNSYYARFSGDQLVQWEDLGELSGSEMLEPYSDGNRAYWANKTGVYVFDVYKGLSKLSSETLNDTWGDFGNQWMTLFTATIAPLYSGKGEAIQLSLPKWDQNDGSTLGDGTYDAPSWPEQQGHGSFSSHNIYLPADSVATGNYWLDFGLRPSLWMFRGKLEVTGTIPLLDFIIGPNKSTWMHQRGGSFYWDESASDDDHCEALGDRTIENDAIDGLLETHAHRYGETAKDLLIDRVYSRLETIVASGGTDTVEITIEVTNPGGTVTDAIDVPAGEAQNFIELETGRDLKIQIRENIDSGRIRWKEVALFGEIVQRKMD